MEAGPEMDRLIAEKVMGWRRSVQVSVSLDRHGRSVWRDSKGIEAARNDLPAFSTDMAAAWQVVEALQERGWHLTLAHDDYTNKWSAMFWRKTGDMPFDPVAHYIVDDLEPATAICRAALKAVEGRANVGKDGG